jgi:dihydrolipoamide dehydrogenase
VIGGGVIGLEFASIFRSFGCEVTVLEYCKDILPRFDTDLAKRLKQSLGKRGIDIETQAQVTDIEILHADLNVQSSDEPGKDSGDVSGET